MPTYFCFLFVFFLHVSFSQQLDFSSINNTPVNSNCINPLGERGSCLELAQCPDLYAILNQGPIVSRERIIFLQKSTCGFITSTTNAEEIPKVCCTSATKTESSIISPTTTPKITKLIPDYERNNRTTVKSLGLLPSAEIANLIQSHPNVGLLPTHKSCGQSNSFADRVVGGENAGLGSYPWMVLLGFSYDGGDNETHDVSFGCGGSLINEKYVLTASHCLLNLPKGFKFSIARIGEYDQSQALDCTSDGICAPPAQDLEVEEVITHKGYNQEGTNENDIALIRLKTPAKLGRFITPICLPLKLPQEFNSEQKEVDRNSILVAGWGRFDTNNETGTDILQEVVLPLVPNDKCNQFFAKLFRGQEIGEARFCTGGSGGKDSCNGDSGGPIMGYLSPSTARQQRVYQFGIVSLGGQSCGTESEPSLNARIVFYLPWILDNLKP